MSGGQVSFFLALFHLFASLVPRSFHPFCASFGNHFVFFILRRIREGVKENLRVIGRGGYSEEEVSRLAKRCFQNYCHKLLDYMAMDRLTSSNKEKWVEKEVGEEHLKEVLARGKGAICVTPHLSHWELGGYILASKGYPINILTLQEESRYLSRYEEQLRKRVGIRTLYYNPRERPNLAILEMAKRLRGNEIIAMVSDRTFGNQGMETDFFGRKTILPSGAVYLALETGAALIPVFVVLEKKMKYWGIVGEAIPLRMEGDKEEAVKQGVQEMARRFEGMISRYPDQWFNFFPFWRGR
jgi:lauroyl/myristoyl acyltransferase